MYRSCALTLAAVTRRVCLPLASLVGIPFENAYRVVAWMRRVPNLLVAEAWFVPHAGPFRLTAPADRFLYRGGRGAPLS